MHFFIKYYILYVIFLEGLDMFNLNEDKLLCSELVHTFPKDMILRIEKIINQLCNYDIKGVSAIKGINEHYNILFEIEEIYKIIFDYYENKTMSLKFTNKIDEQILNVKDVTEASNEKINLIIQVIEETIYKDKLINNTNKTK